MSLLGCDIPDNHRPLQVLQPGGGGKRWVHQGNENCRVESEDWGLFQDGVACLAAGVSSPPRSSDCSVMLRDQGPRWIVSKCPQVYGMTAEKTQEGGGTLGEGRPSLQF